jgi:hypothetical protein
MTNPIIRGAFISLSTRPAGGRSAAVNPTPFFAADVPLGLSSIANAAVSALQPLIPFRMSGLNVNEPLHRLDANAHLPALDRGVTSANRLGEALGALSMRWLVAPDDFEATPSATPPWTPLDSSRSQRFVMRDGALTFADRGEGTLRFFGAGRTYPATVGNQARLFFAGTAVVLDGAGSLKGTRGTLAITGEITRTGGIALSVLGHFDADGPLLVEDTLGPLVDGVELGP